MFCRKCGTELEETTAICPVCGEQQNTMDKNLKILVTVLCIALLAVVLAVVIMMSIKGKKPEEPANDSITTQQDSSAEDETLSTDFGSYTVSDEVLTADRDLVVTRLGDYEMTVADLQLNYWFQVYMYYDDNQQNIAYGYIKLDIRQPLDTQACTENPTISWQQYFVNKATAAWSSYAAMNMMADQDGYELPADTMENMKTAMIPDAQEKGFETVDEYVVDMLRSDVGEAVTAEDYWEYRKLFERATKYFAAWQEQNMPTEQEMEAYYTENEAALAQSGVTKENCNLVDVRHILVMTENEDWAAAEKEANEILQQWQAGGATEEQFALLANQYSDDSGSNTTGGLYSDVQPGQMVEVFNNWIMDDSRKYGDTAILKADYHYQGYHVMYFVSGQPIWKMVVQQAMLTEISSVMMKDAVEKWPMEKLEENIKLGTPLFE